MAGDQLALDWQIQLDDWLGGPGTDWGIVPPGMSDPTGGAVNAVETPKALADGVAVGADTNGPIVFTASLSTAEANLTAGEAMLALDDLRAVWRAAGTVTKELWMQLPGLGVCYLLGRPRAPEVTLELAYDGVITVMVTFIGTDGELHVEGS